MKCVLVIDRALPLGLIANTAAVLSLSLGQRAESLIGPDVIDASGNVHAGITMLPVPTLGASRDEITALRQRLFAEEFATMLVVGFSGTAQTCKTYTEYREKLAGVESSQLSYLGIGLVGPRKLVNQITGALPLLR
jgi:hypothetical protein